MNASLQRKLIESVTGTVIAHADELTALDQAIGDGDHGLNMKRGATAVLDQLEDLAAKPLPEALKSVGLTLIMKVGGASGPLYGTLFTTLGKALPAVPSHGDVVRAVGEAIAAVKKIGRSDVGQKTMLDVLSPMHEELATGGAGLRDRLRQRASAAADATVPMKATKGRASFLGERSVGHMDPGARSSSLMIAAICVAMDDCAQ
ncbi:MAG: dihydroxyacetone kinase subunit L [Betaproteobacteria bacterium]|nr:MAG: dihydroxyacetone kinase subunit L [Betaproteobacteria bacterium]